MTKREREREREEEREREREMSLTLGFGGRRVARMEFLLPPRAFFISFFASLFRPGKGQVRDKKIGDRR